MDDWTEEDRMNVASLPATRCVYPYGAEGSLCGSVGYNTMCQKVNLTEVSA